MEVYKLIIKGSLGSDTKGKIHDNTKVFPADVVVTSYTARETVYEVKVNGGMNFEKALVKWFTETQGQAPYPEGTLLYYTRIHGENNHD